MWQNHFVNFVYTISAAYAAKTVRLPYRNTVIVTKWCLINICHCQLKLAEKEKTAHKYLKMFYTSSKWILTSILISQCFTVKF